MIGRSPTERLRTDYAQGLREEERARAATLYIEAFRAKLGPILGRKGEGLLAATWHLDRAVVARRDGLLLGLAGLHYGDKSLVGISSASLRQTYGWIGGAARSLALSLFDRKAEPGELLLDGIVVAPEARGQGLGTELLNRVVAVAIENGLDRIRLDVVDSNPGARRLYERNGFVATITESAPALRRWFGFGASTTMIRRVDDARGRV